MTNEAIAAEVVRIRNSGVLGQPGPLVALFEFLAARTAQGAPPKEIEIAIEVFGKDGGAESVQDANVRVYIHRLRRKLEDFYLRENNPGGIRLMIPKGDYRFIIAPTESTDTPEEEPPNPTVASRSFNTRTIGIAAALVVIVLNIAGWVWVGGRAADPSRDPGFFAEISANTTPLMIVLGDYYLLGESDDGLNVNRLVREYDINSREDLYSYLMDHQDKMGRYVDLGLSYLPTSMAKALLSVSLRLPQNKRIQIMMATEFPTEALRRNDVIYIGLMSGLGQLRGRVLAASRFSIGETYDEIIDTKDGTRYFSQAASSVADGKMYRDYGYISSFAGPTGNRIIIIAGTRDAAAAGAADAINQPSFLKDISDAVGGADSFEALYEVQAEGRVNLQSRLITASPLNPDKIWSAVTQSRPKSLPR